MISLYSSHTIKIANILHFSQTGKRFKQSEAEHLRDSSGDKVSNNQWTYHYAQEQTQSADEAANDLSSKIWANHL